MAEGMRPDLGQRLRWEQDAKGELLIFDCSNNTREEAWELLEAFDQAITPKPLGTVRVLTNFENAYHEPKLTAHWKANFEGHTDHVQKMACINISSGMKVVLAAYRFFTRLRGLDVDNRLRFFNDEKSARDWLAE